METVINRVETQFDKMVDAAYEEYCQKMVLKTILEDILKDATCSESVKELATYGLGLVNNGK
jgi:hypothetical protein